MKIMRKKKDKFGIILGTLMIIGTFLPYLTYWGNEARLIGTRYGTIVIVGGIITIISGLLRIEVGGVGCLVGGIVSLAGWYGGGVYYSEVLSEYIDIASLINKGTGQYVILLSSFFTILAGLYATLFVFIFTVFDDAVEAEKHSLKNKGATCEEKEK